MASDNNYSTQAANSEDARPHDPTLTLLLSHIAAYRARTAMRAASWTRIMDDAKSRIWKRKTMARRERTIQKRRDHNRTYLAERRRLTRRGDLELSNMLANIPPDASAFAPQDRLERLIAYIASRRGSGDRWRQCAGWYVLAWECRAFLLASFRKASLQNIANEMNRRMEIEATKYEVRRALKRIRELERAGVWPDES